MEVHQRVEDESEILLSRVDRRLTTLRADRSCAPHVPHAEQLADQLRLLVRDTAAADVADRARVRAAVHYFAGMRDKRQRRPRDIAAELRNVRRMTRDIASINSRQR